MDNKKTVQIIQKKVKVNNKKFILSSQILFYCITNDIWLNENEYRVLLHIAEKGYDKIKTLREIVDQKIYKSIQTVRNVRGKLTKMKLLVEDKKSKTYSINPTVVKLESNTVLLDIKMLCDVS